MEMSFIILFLSTFFVMFAIYLGTFIWNYFREEKVDSIVDVLWGLNYVMYTVFFFVFSKGTYMDFVILFVMLLSGFRLFSTILSKKTKGELKEDKRYMVMKNNFSSRYFNVRRFMQFYVLQMILGAVIMLPVMYFLHFNFEILPIYDILFKIGLFILGIGLFIENLADLQLEEYIKFQKVGKNSFLSDGLFKYSRHPNYFGESLFWFGICTICSIISPLSYISWIIITFLLVRVSGIPFAELRFKDNEEYQKYKKRTSSFILWFPKNT